MNSMYELCQVLFRTGQWDYYGDSWYFPDDIADVLRNSENFITSMLQNGEKLSYETTELMSELSHTQRLSHTVSIYFFGLLLYTNVKAIQLSIDKFINKLNVEGDADRDFTYLWFMLCFFHDIGYSFEIKDPNVALGDLLTKQDGKLSLTIPPFWPNGIPPRISRNIHKYLKYRYIDDMKLDHGIVGGALFWFERHNDYFKRRQNHRSDTFIENNRLFSKPILFKLQKTVAWTIAAHNVWFCYKEEDIDKYNRYDLADLIINRPVISLETHPLLFLLSIVDTVDPVKFLQRNYSMTYNDMEHIIKFDFRDDGFFFSITNIDEDTRTEFLNSLCELSRWVQCNVYQRNGILDISF